MVQRELAEERVRVVDEDQPSELLVCDGVERARPDLELRVYGGRARALERIVAKPLGPAVCAAKGDLESHIDGVVGSGRSFEFDAKVACVRGRVSSKGTMELREALADPKVFDTLEARPIKYANANALAKLTFELDPEAERGSGDELVALGWKHVGARQENVVGSDKKRDFLDVFVDDAGTTYAAVRRRTARAGLYTKLSNYFLITLFDDGMIVETAARPTKMPDGPFLIHRSGTEKLLDDVDAHRNFLLERVAQGKKILPMKTLDDTQRVLRYLYSHGLSAEMAFGVARINENNKRLDAMIKDSLVYVIGFGIFVVLIVLWWLNR